MFASTCITDRYREYIIWMCALCVLYRWGSLYGFLRSFSESDLGLLSAGVTTTFVDGFSMTMMAPCQIWGFQEPPQTDKHSLVLPSPVTWMVGKTWEKDTV